MKGITVTKFGSTDVLTYTEINLRPLAKGEVRVKLKAIGVNPVDTYIRSGVYANLPTLPYTPGSDGAGVIEAVGPEVTRVKLGDHVFTTSLGTTNTGTYAEAVICDEDSVFIFPETISFEQAASLGTTGLTAIQALHQRGNIKPGETVLIHGATGGVGTIAVQLARLAGARVIATAGSPAGETLLTSIGADFVLNHHQKDYRRRLSELTDYQGIDLLIEMLANVNLQQDFDWMAIGGRIVIVGNRGEIQINPRSIMAKDLDVKGVMLGNMSLKQRQENIARLTAALEHGVAPVIETSFPLAEASSAHEAILEQRGSLGKIILSV